jgi:hypothetical protein
LTQPRLLIVGLLLVDSLYYIFARLLLPLLPPAAGAMYMMVVGAVQVALLMGGRVDWRVLWRHRRLFLTVGLLVGVNTTMGFVAVRYVGHGVAPVAHVDPGRSRARCRLAGRAAAAVGGPVVTWLWSVLAFGGQPMATEIGGGLATLAGVLLVTASRAGWLDTPCGAS